MTIQFIWLSLIFIGISSLVYIIVEKVMMRISINSRLNKDYGTSHKKAVKRKEKVFTRELKKLGNKITDMTPKNVKAKMEESISLSGVQVQVGTILLCKLFLLVCFTAAALLVGVRINKLSLKVFIIIIFSMVGFMLPNLYLIRKGKSRQLQIRKALPAFIDYLAISVEAGLGLDLAILRVIKLIKGPLAEEIANAMVEIKYGKSKKDAFKNMAEKVRVPEFTSFINAVINGEQFGISITNVLKMQGEQIREKRRQRMREEAYKSPIKLVFPLIIFILPTLFVILLGPAALQLFQLLTK